MLFRYVNIFAYIIDEIYLNNELKLLRYQRNNKFNIYIYDKIKYLIKRINKIRKF